MARGSKPTWADFKGRLAAFDRACSSLVHRGRIRLQVRSR